MNLSGLLPLVSELAAYRLLREGGIDEPLALPSAARPYVAAQLALDSPGPLLILSADHDAALRWRDRLHHFLPSEDDGGPPVYLLAEPDALPFERIIWSDRTRQQRLTALTALQGQSTLQPVIIASSQALLQMSLPPRELRLALRPLRVGSFVRLDELTADWAASGYEPVEVVEEPGTFARRGGIIDIWPPNLPLPVRIDLFGDEVDSLRVFDPSSQRTEYRVERIEIGPGSEALSKYGSMAAERLQSGADGSQTKPSTPDPTRRPPVQDPNLLLAIREEIRSEIELLAESRSFRGIEWYLPYFYSRPASLLDHLPAAATIVVDDGGDLAATCAQIDDRVDSLRAELTRSGEAPAGYRSSFFPSQEILSALAARQPIILGFSDLTGRAQSEQTALSRSFAPATRYGGETKRILRDLHQLNEQGQQVLLVTRQAGRMQEELNQAELGVDLRADLTGRPGPGITLLQDVIDEGFVLRPAPPGQDAADGQTTERSLSAPRALYLFSDTELFGWIKPAARKRRKPQSTVAPELFFADVKPGDYVVHMEHGIGQYEGLVQLELGAGSDADESSGQRSREYLQVNYAQNDKLYVPVHQADRLSRYVGAGDGGIPPSVSRLGTADWQAVKEKARKAVEDIAEDLLHLYAEREVIHGHPFSPDGPWQEEMESAFPFQETEDQIQAIVDVKADMESAQPMDRIIIGDVGYGKTEIAVRAAFKAVMDGRQAAVLVPTTVLAQQHYHTFGDRLAQFPVKVEMLSRFRTQSQQAQVLQGLADGSVDIVIGTHRLLSQDIDFRQLGLLVIDEEQRFGVSHKERLKQMRTQVDVLTLSATPIPRTLHMSLSGVRDMSTINTPPHERLPVRTVLSEYDEHLVQQAIRRELERDGQVFFVHNRVRGIVQIATRLRRLLPDAEIGVAHGQMAERQLEEMMVRFAAGEIDVLVCTTIVENGLDIRRANTMIVNRANHFGLAQLYQLRGRVGRGAVRGYCFLLYDKHTALTFDARRRLEALLESSEELGAGFRIAMRDLEIRGAGELLGARQHGQISTVGFDLYTRLLAQAINDLQEKKRRFEAAESAGQVETTDKHRNGDSPQHGRNAGQHVTRDEDDGTPLPFAIDDPLAPPVTLDLPFVAEIPAGYVGEEGLRFQLYRRIAGLTRVDEIAAMGAELIDRFGDNGSGSLPVPVENLLYQIRIKLLALAAGVPNIGRRRDQIAVRIVDPGDRKRRTLQRELRMALGHTTDAGEFVPEDGIHVGREAIYIPIDGEDFWRLLLVKVLEYLAIDRP